MTTFSELVKDFSHIRLATREDNERILSFYKEQVMETGEENISFERGDDFFAFYELTTSQYWCFLFLNKDMSIGGIGSILRHHRTIKESLLPVAYFCDLRVSKNASRITKVQWRKFFDHIISNLRNLQTDQYCHSAYTAILEDNDAAVNSLTKSGRGVVYRPLGKYYVNSYLNAGLIRSVKYVVKEISLEAFVDFYMDNARGLSLAQDPHYLMEQISNKSEYQTQIGIYEQDQLIAIAMPVLKNATRQLRIQKMNRSKKIAASLVKALGRPTPNEDGSLNTLDISLFVVNNKICFEDTSKIIQSIQTWTKDEKLLKRTHIVNVTSANRPIKSSLLRDGICFTTVGNLYEIHSPDHDGIFPKDCFRFEGAFL